jgi:hypothetical protein
MSQTGGFSGSRPLIPETGLFSRSLVLSRSTIFRHTSGYSVSQSLEIGTEITELVPVVSSLHSSTRTVSTASDLRSGTRTFGTANVHSSTGTVSAANVDFSTVSTASDLHSSARTVTGVEDSGSDKLSVSKVCSGTAEFVYSENFSESVWVSENSESTVSIPSSFSEDSEVPLSSFTMEVPSFAPTDKFWESNRFQESDLILSELLTSESREVSLPPTTTAQTKIWTRSFMSTERSEASIDGGRNVGKSESPGLMIGIGCVLLGGVGIAFWIRAAYMENEVNWRRAQQAEKIRQPNSSLDP